VATGNDYKASLPQGEVRIRLNVKSLKMKPFAFWVGGFMVMLGVHDLTTKPAT
jgi:hypothetical protein